jgi:hypothetical protein
LEQLDAEIERLHRLQLSYQALQALTATDGTVPAKYPVAGIAAPTVTATDADTALKTAYTGLYTAQGVMNEQNNILYSKSEADQKVYVTDPAYTGAVKGVSDARAALDKQIKDNQDNNAAWTKYNLATASGQL